MSLDTVELLVAWEKAFEIEIPDLDVEQIITVSDATNTILRHVSLQPTGSCRSQALFYQFRQYFETVLNVAPSRFQPTTPLHTLLPVENRREMWQAMEKSLGWTLPELPLVDAMRAPKLIKSFGRINRPNEPPAPHYTVRACIDFVFALNYQILVALPKVASRYEVEKVVMGITCDKAGVSIYEVKPESSFTSDLGMD